MIRPGTGLRRGKSPLRLYDPMPRRAEWKKHTYWEAADVVKGMNRRVIVVRSPDPKMFEEAIFILREDYLRDRNEAQVLDEARRAAGEYLRTRTGVKKRTRRWLWAVLVGVLALAAAAYLVLPYVI